MSTFASKTPRDLNHDPHPWLDPEADPRVTPYWRASYQMTGMVNAPRPEFDHVQHNEPNPILVAFRLKPTRPEEDAARTLAEHVDDALFACRIYRVENFQHIVDRDGLALTVTPDHIDHARRVLTRLGRFSR